MAVFRHEFRVVAILQITAVLSNIVQCAISVIELREFCLYNLRTSGANGANEFSEQYVSVVCNLRKCHTHTTQLTPSKNDKHKHSVSENYFDHYLLVPNRNTHHYCVVIVFLVSAKEQHEPSFFYITPVQVISKNGKLTLFQRNKRLVYLGYFKM